MSQDMLRESLLPFNNTRTLTKSFEKTSAKGGKPAPGPKVIITPPKEGPNPVAVFLDDAGRVSRVARDRFALFLIGWLGGPQTYVETHGHPRLRMRHARVRVDSAARDAWWVPLGFVVLFPLRSAMDVLTIYGLAWVGRSVIRDLRSSSKTKASRRGATDDPHPPFCENGASTFRSP